MQQTKAMTRSWGIGLTTEQAMLLRSTLGEEHKLVFLAPGELKHMHSQEPEPPFVLWMSSACRGELENLPEFLAQRIAASPKVLLLDKEYSLEDFESACDYGFTEILRPPFSRERIADVMRRALEAHALHYDMECMTREILLERELLERKNEILTFLVSFLTNSTESLDPGYLLQNAYSGLEKLLPVRTLHAVLWEQSAEGTPLLSLFICAPDGSTAHEVWRELLLEQARLSVGADFSVSEINRLQLHGQPEECTACLPNEGNLLSLPLICGNERLGLLVLATSMDRHLGRDQAMALDSAMRHFSLSIKNARRFRLMQMYADYDALTKVHSRRHFETRLDEEMERLTRYGEPLSIIMLDIDHFKQVNDNHGHNVGDIVLREVAEIVAESIRTTDYCARYGGEEFAVLLPHTDSKKALYLAERMRKKVADHTFLVDGGAPIKLSVSLGISSLHKGAQKNKQALVCEADTALYKAKKSGRNRCCLASQASTIVEGRRNTG